MKYGWGFHILNFLHFSDSLNQPDENDKNYYRFRKIGTLLIKGAVIFKQYIPKKCKHFGIKIYKLCDMTGYTYNMRIYLGKGQAKCSTDNDSEKTD